PLAGQGINLGLADVKVLSECILAAHKRGQSVGDIAVLNRYQRQRKGDNLAMMTAVEGFKRLFAPIPLPLRWLRNAGMNILQQRATLKNKIIKYAMGII
ncbi:MAG TPA: 2-octaprenyl-3-methyl-6-methoxy-1,4-benzoquinol hydroxylase, partial [Cellvibrionales bacterium]|nr:2-octaprenyl-3-methyl-6-methoxy-1,4-benzoquinol hydroxylase [Cellvibrionales bacterium]